MKMTSVIIIALAVAVEHHMPGWMLRMLLSAQNDRFVVNVKWRW